MHVQIEQMKKKPCISKWRRKGDIYIYIYIYINIYVTAPRNFHTPGRNLHIRIILRSRNISVRLWLHGRLSGQLRRKAEERLLRKAEERLLSQPRRLRNGSEGKLRSVSEGASSQASEGSELSEDSSGSELSEVGSTSRRYQSACACLRSGR